MVSKPDDSTMASSMAIKSNGNPKWFKQVLSIKFNNENYLLWKQQVMATIRGHSLLHFLEPSSTPSRFLSAQDEIQRNISTNCLEWEQQDQFLVSWLLSSMAEGVLTRMVGCDTASQIWAKLNTYFVAQTRTKFLS